MYGDLSKIEEMKLKLNSVSRSFCMAKWMHCTIHLLNGRSHSCYLPPTHKIPLDEIRKDPSALHNTVHKKQVRKMMKEGVRPEECSICWKVEDLPGGQYSDRHYHGVDSWTMPYFDQVRQMDWSENINPSYVEVSWSSVCNFKCMYCSPTVSTAWMKEIKESGSYKLSRSEHQYLPWFEEQGLIPLDEATNPYIEAFWKWWPDLVSSLMYFRITGGEPLLSRHTFKALEWLNEHPQPHLALSVNSNLGIPRKQFDRFMELLKPLMHEKKIREHVLHTSIDAWGERAEYIRNGLDFSLFNEYLDIYLKEFQESTVALICTFNILSVTGFKRYLEWILELRTKYARYDGKPGRILVDIPHLQAPEIFAANILPDSYIEYVDESLSFMKAHLGEKDGFTRAEHFKLSRIREWMKNRPSEAELKRHRADFFLFYREHDRRRGTSFLDTFPEMADFYRLCESEANESTGTGSNPDNPATSPDPDCV